MSNTKASTEYEIIKEGEEVLFKHLGLAKATRFWIAFNSGVGDYVATKKRLFSGETVSTLYPEIEKYQEEKSKE